jgi:hypothetical protein
MKSLVQKHKLIFCQKKQNEIGSLTHHWKEENEIFPKGYFLPRETDCNMEKWPLMCQIECIFLKMTRYIGAPWLVIELQLLINQKVLEI